VLARIRWWQAESPSKGGSALGEDLQPPCSAGSPSSRGDLTETARRIRATPAQDDRAPDFLPGTTPLWLEGRLREAEDGPAAAGHLLLPLFSGAGAYRMLLAKEPGAAAWLVRTALAFGRPSGSRRGRRLTRRGGCNSNGHRSVVAAAVHATRIQERDLALVAAAAEHHVVTVKVEKGLVTLSGTVDWDFQRRAAERAVRKLPAAAAISNQLPVRPSAPSEGRQAQDRAGDRAPGSRRGTPCHSLNSRMVTYLSAAALARGRSAAKPSSPPGRRLA
jgi:hypothetical protein